MRISPVRFCGAAWHLHDVDGGAAEVSRRQSRWRRHRAFWWVGHCDGTGYLFLLLVGDDISGDIARRKPASGLVSRLLVLEVPAIQCFSDFSQREFL